MSFSDERTEEEVEQFDELLTEAMGWKLLKGTHILPRYFAPLFCPAILPRYFAPLFCPAILPRYFVLGYGGVVTGLTDFRRVENIHFLISWLTAENKETESTGIGITWGLFQTQKGSFMADIDLDGQTVYPYTGGETASEALGWAILKYKKDKAARDLERQAESEYYGRN